MSLKIPLQFNPQRGFEKDTSTSDSIRNIINLIVNTAISSCTSSPSFGFALKNYQFEIFDEKKGTIALHPNTTFVSPSYKLKIQGNSRDFNTFANELKEQIIQYEPRLRDVNVQMDYTQVDKNIKISIKGFIMEKTIEKFEHIINQHVW